MDGLRRRTRVSSQLSAISNEEDYDFSSSGGGSRPAYGLQRDANGDDEKRVLAERRHLVRNPDKDHRVLRRQQETAVLTLAHEQGTAVLSTRTPHLRDDHHGRLSLSFPAHPPGRSPQRLRMPCTLLGKRCLVPFCVGLFLFPDIDYKTFQ